MAVIVYSGILIIVLVRYSNLPLTKKKKAICFLGFLLMFSITILRSTSYGDLSGYSRHYMSYSMESYQQLWISYKNGLLKDFGFYAIAKFLNNLGVSTATWLNIIGFVFCSTISYKIYKESDEPLLSFLIILVFYFRFTMTAVRQSVAISIILISMKYLNERRPIRFIICILCASVFHSSAIVFLPAYWISKLKVGKKQLAIIALGFIISMFMPNVFKNAISRVFWDERLAGYANSQKTLSWAGYIIQLAIFIFCYIFHTSDVQREEYAYRNRVETSLNLMMVGLFFQGFTTSLAEVFRLSYYYSIVNCIMLPNTIANNRLETNKRMLRVSVFSVLIIYMMISKMYVDIPFFWET